CARSGDYDGYFDVW
nr:immunoglobulin heavy chain junction region [Mus musculus]